MNDKILPSNLYHRAQFFKSAPNLKLCPPDKGFEVAFVGRSNSGKSSAINAITGINRLARTSKTPGRTQLINFFSLDNERRLVDLPGYGYAKVPDRVKLDIEKILETYLSGRDCLCGLVMMMDIRHPLSQFDQQLIEVAKHYSLPVHVILTKSDKLKRAQAIKTHKEVKKFLDGLDHLISVQTFSALKLIGLDEAKLKLDEWFQLNSLTENE